MNKPLLSGLIFLFLFSSTIYADQPSAPIPAPTTVGAGPSSGGPLSSTGPISVTTTGAAQATAPAASQAPPANLPAAAAPQYQAGQKAMNEYQNEVDKAAEKQILYPNTAINGTCNALLRDCILAGYHMSAPAGRNASDCMNALLQDVPVRPSNMVITPEVAAHYNTCRALKNPDHPYDLFKGPPAAAKPDTTAKTPATPAAEPTKYTDPGE